MFATLALASLISLTAYLCFAYLSERQDSKLKLAPGPKGLPLIGSLLDLMWATGDGTPPFQVLCDWALHYGPLCYVRFASHRVVIVSDAQVAQQMCVKMADNFSGRPSGLFISRILKDKGIVFNVGESWKAHRMFVQQEFRKFGFSRQSIEEPIQQIADDLLNQIQKHGAEAHDVHLHLATATYNIIWNFISGKTFEWNDPFLQKLISNLEQNLDAMELVGAHNYSIPLTLIHFLVHNPWTLGWIVLDRFAYFRKLIDAQKKHTDGYDMIGSYLSKINDPNNNHFKETQLLFLISDLFIAGGETTITTLRWVLLCLALHPPMQERIRNEMRDSVGLDSPVSYTQRALLPFFEAFLHEVFRHCGITPGMWRNTEQDCVVQGYDIPKGTWILLHFRAMNFQDLSWPDSRQFRPERFLDEDGKFKKNDNFVAFSLGRRQCPGEALARTEIFVLISRILQKFRITCADHLPDDVLLRGHFGVTYMPPKFRLQFDKVTD